MTDDQQTYDGEQASLEADTATAQLQGELEANLEHGLVPDGWEHRIEWDLEDEKSRGGLIPAVSAVAAISVAAAVAWGWGAGLSALIFSGCATFALMISRGPSVGATVRHVFTPPPEAVFEAGIAGHKLVDVTRPRPFFFVSETATRQDVWAARRSGWLVALGFAIAGGLVLLEQSATITPAAFLRVSALLGAALSVAFAVWTWRAYGKILPLLAEHQPRAKKQHDPDPAQQILDTATTGGSPTDTIGRSLLGLLPPNALRVVVPTLILASGLLPVLVAFSLAPDRSELWSGLTAAAQLLVFVLACVRALLLLVMAVVWRDGAAVKGALAMLALMLVLLVAARLFGWLDEWGAVINWVSERLG